MLKVWKYPLEITDSQDIEVPGGTKFLSATEQSNILVVYALVNPESRPKARATILIRGTGHPIDHYMPMTHRFLGTISTHGGYYWHIFVPKEY